ncbi:hypothetical protein E1180_09360 [Roseibium denhamense]|uniref:Holin n=1 Tax=Roseibium denhamense TaxID=76305 RepID=A0ABY1PP94_9HYPH|nr:hypothetical protein [Roseibium denhamense]MTI05722.1 hypothetical protein [Roseibium denhamense]SMP36947.1 hypothetical protein SAMN06265374_4391 [Roseibium denhamense]
MHGWKTLVFNGTVGLTALCAEVLSYLEAADWHSVLPEGQAALVIAALGFANILLRHVTTGPAGWKRPH